MSGFYRIDYAGKAGSGAGAIALANGKIAGLDIYGGIFSGTYTEEGGKLHGTAHLTYAQGGTLVNGMQVPPGASIPISLSIPAGHIAGYAVNANVPGGQVGVLLTRVAEL